MKKNYDVEIFRFVGILSIVLYHLYVIIPGQIYPFASGWMFTDFFFVITGYYTVLHFRKKEDYITEVKSNSLSPQLYDAMGIVTYVWKKYKKFLPYIIPSVCVIYALDCFEKLSSGAGIRLIIGKLQALPLEIGLLTSAFDYERFGGAIQFPLDAPLWFLSAMLLMLPLYCFCIKYKKSGVFYVLSVLAFAMGLGISGDRFFTNDLLRATLGLFSGMFVFFVREIIKNHYSKSIFTSWGGYLILAIVLMLLYFNASCFQLIRLLLDFALVLIVISDVQTVPKKMQLFVGLLGEISIPLFIWHWTIAKVVNICFNDLEGVIRGIIYIGCSLFIAILSFALVGVTKGLKLKRKNE